MLKAGRNSLRKLQLVIHLEWGCVGGVSACCGLEGWGGSVVIPVCVFTCPVSHPGDPTQRQEPNRSWLEEVLLMLLCSANVNCQWLPKAPLEYHVVLKLLWFSIPSMVFLPTQNEGILLSVWFCLLDSEILKDCCSFLCFLLKFSSNCPWESFNKWSFHLFIHPFLALIITNCCWIFI